MRTGVRQFESRNYIVRHIKRDMFFGYSLLLYDQFYIPVSDIEKTLIDLVYFGIRVPDETLVTIIRRLNRDTFNTYLAEIPENLSKRIRKVANKKKK